MEASNKWLTSADLFAETEGFLTALQDQVILTRNYKKCILKQLNTDELCRRCGKESEPIQRITAACEQLAPTEYVKRHDGVAKVIRNWQKQLNWWKTKVHIISTHQPMWVVPKSLSQCLKRLNLPQIHIYKCKICNSWHIFNCKKLSKL